jgi:hypothetical protein
MSKYKDIWQCIRCKGWMQNTDINCKFCTQEQIKEYKAKLKQKRDSKNMIIKKKIWLILAENRTKIAVGVPRCRYLVDVDNMGKKRLLYYDSKAKAESAWTVSGFYNEPHPRPANYFEAVESELTIKI